MVPSMTTHDDEDSPWDDTEEFDAPEDDERKVDEWKDVPLSDLFEDIRDDLRRLA